MVPKAGQYIAVNRTPYKVVMVQPSYVVAEHFDSGMGVTFTRDYLTDNAKFCTFAWAVVDETGNYTLSEEVPPTPGTTAVVPITSKVKQVVVIAL